MKTAIVSGANGFVGSALVKVLVKNKIKVIALDLEGHNQNLPNSSMVKFVPFDFTKSDLIRDILLAEKADTFFHFAWVGSAGPGRADYALQLNNAKWTIDCIKLAKEVGCSRFINAGSIMEHETIAATFQQENKPGLGYIYGSGKLVAHTMGMSIASNIGIDLIWAKITNAYGPGELSPRFINTTLRKIINSEELVFTSGTQNYDFVYIDDVAEAFYLIGKNGKPFSHYLIGSSNARPLKEFILELKDAIDPTLKLVFGNIPFSGVNMPLSEFDCSITEKDTEFKAKESFKTGVKKTYDWLRSNE